MNSVNQSRTTAVKRLLATVAASVCLGVPVGVAQEGAETTQVTGVFDGGQEWQISVPDGWNGIVVNDLDSVGSVEDQSMRATYFLENGYAYSGTRRHPDRNINWDPQAESDNMVRVLDQFEEQIGDPRFAIQFGCSGGGSVGLSVAEDHPDRFDGVISMHASTPVELANMRLDLAVALKTLLDPEGDLKTIIADGEQDEAREAWQAVLNEVKKTPEGRARMALATALAQYPIWGSQGSPEADLPDWNDPESLQDAMVRVAVDGALRSVTGRPMWDNPAGVMSWTAGIDYHEFYENADEKQRGLVRNMYEEAGLDPKADIAADIDRINAWPRVEATAEGIEYFRTRTHSGAIGIPALHISNIGDGGTPATVMAGYVAKIEREGTEDMYRQAFINASGHCTFNEAELAAATAVMVERLETGEWNSVDPEAMNALGVSKGEARYIALDEGHEFRLPDHFNRAFFRDSEVPNQ